MTGAIVGVQTKHIIRFCDDRGFLSEVLKVDDPFFKPILQTSYTETYPGIIKAFHYHKRQDDYWFVVKGNAQIVLHDLRDDSPSKLETMVLYAGEQTPLLVCIPAGVAHGYRVLGNQPVGLLYFTTQAYDPLHPDEERLPFDDPQIGFDWATKNR